MKKNGIILIIGAVLGYLGYRFFLKGGKVPELANKVIAGANQALVDIKAEFLPSTQTPAVVNQATVTYIDPKLQPFVADPEIVKATEGLLRAIPFKLGTVIVQDGSAQSYYNRIMEIILSVPAGELNYNPKYMPQINEIYDLEQKIGAMGYEQDNVNWRLVKKPEAVLAAERQAATEAAAIEATAYRIKRQALRDEYAAAYLKANPEVGAEYAARVAALQISL